MKKIGPSTDSNDNNHMCSSSKHVSTCIRRSSSRSRDAASADSKHIICSSYPMILLSLALLCASWLNDFGVEGIRLPFVGRIVTPAVDLGRTQQQRRENWSRGNRIQQQGHIIDEKREEDYWNTCHEINDGSAPQKNWNHIPRGGGAAYDDSDADLPPDLPSFEYGQGSGGSGGGGPNNPPQQPQQQPYPSQNRPPDQNQHQQYYNQRDGYDNSNNEPPMPDDVYGGQYGSSNTYQTEPELPPGNGGDGYSNHMPDRLPRQHIYHPPPRQGGDHPYDGRRGSQPPSPQSPSDNRYASRQSPPPPLPGAHHPSNAAASSSSGPSSTMDSSEGVNRPDLSNFDKDMIFKGLKRMYRKKIMPVEVASRYNLFGTEPMGPSDFDAKPMVLLLGQYSVGKTSFIRYLLGNKDFPGIRIGPEPTTDRFVSIMQGKVDKIVPGAALCSQSDKPFQGLSTFGNNFLSRFEGVEMDSPILKNITLVDTPGILSGQKQSIGRNYDYEAVMKWFAERADLIVIMFDAHKLDISDELKRVIELMKPHADKVRVVLNKADCVSTQQLMRVYGSLMWSLGKVMKTPEVCRVFMGSFWGAPLQNKDQERLLLQEKMDLFNDIAKLPENAVYRRINELVKRARSVKVHAFIIHFLRKQMPYKPWGKKDKQRRLIDNLEREFQMCARRYNLAIGDFPEIGPFRRALREIKDITEIPKIDKKAIKEMDLVFSVEIPAMLQQASNIK